MSDFELTFSPTGEVTIRGHGGSFARESRVRVDGRVLERHLSDHFAGPMADLIDVGMAAYAADRLCPRPKRRDRYEHFWHRRIHVTVPVRALSIWGDSHVRRCLEEVLAFLTEDEWTFQFVEHAGKQRITQGELFDPRPRSPVAVCLFSGGLDSLAGLGRDLQESADPTFVLFSGYTHGRLAKIQRELAEGIEGPFPGRVRLIQVPFGIRHESHSYNRDERTQRSRGFAHGMLGSAVALASGAQSLRCYENGVGALNLPLTEAQIGAQNARSAHPVALEEIANLVQIVTGLPFRIELPGIFRTKAEICRSIAGGDIAPLVSETVSCDGFPLRIQGTRQCGCCTSCVLRRQALSVAGLAEHDPAAPYRYDLHDAGSWKGEHVTFGMSAMLYQVGRMQAALASADAWHALCREFPMLEHAVLALARWGWSPDETRAGISRVYRSYCAEWEAFAQQSFTFAA